MNDDQVQFRLRDLCGNANNRQAGSRLKSDCLYELEGKAESHAKWLHEWLLTHPPTNARLNRSVIIAALIIATAIVLAAFISRPSGGSRYRSIGTNRIFDVQTGEVKWAEPKD